MSAHIINIIEQRHYCIQSLSVYTVGFSVWWKLSTCSCFSF